MADFFVRVPVSLRPTLEKRAQENDRSVAGEVRAILRQAVEQKPEEQRHLGGRV